VAHRTALHCIDGAFDLLSARFRQASIVAVPSLGGRLLSRFDLILATVRASETVSSTRLRRRSSRLSPKPRRARAWSCGMMDTG
jgi:hypothetical protein